MCISDKAFNMLQKKKTIDTKRPLTGGATIQSKYSKDPQTVYLHDEQVKVTYANDRSR